MSRGVERVMNLGNAYNEFVLGVGGSAHFIRYMRLWNIQREKKSKDMNRLTT